MLLSEARMPEMGGGEIWMRSKGETGARSEVLGVCGVQRARGGPWRACDDGEARTVRCSWAALVTDQSLTKRWVRPRAAYRRSRVQQLRVSGGGRPLRGEAACMRRKASPCCARMGWTS